MCKLSGSWSMEQLQDPGACLDVNLPALRDISAFSALFTILRSTLIRASISRIVEQIPLSPSSFPVSVSGAHISLIPSAAVVSSTCSSGNGKSDSLAIRNIAQLRVTRAIV